MDHVVYLDAKAGELARLLDGTKRMIVRGATGRKLPYGRVHRGDVLYFINNNAEGVVKARAVVKQAIQSDALTAEASRHFILERQALLQLTDAQLKRWAGKRYLVLIEVEHVEMVAPFEINRSGFGSMDDWLPVEAIEKAQRV